MEECAELGYPGYKVHGWDGGWRDADLLEETVRAAGERVGDEMDRMVDPVCSRHVRGRAPGRLGL